MTAVWNTTTAVEFLRKLWTELERVGWHCALTGSVLYRGDSDKDLDVLVFPNSTATASLAKLRRGLQAAGLTPWRTNEQVAELWRKRPVDNQDNKHIEIWMKGARRVDVIVWPIPAATIGPERRKTARGRKIAKPDRRSTWRGDTRRVDDKRKARLQERKR